MSTMGRGQVAIREPTAGLRTRGSRRSHPARGGEKEADHRSGYTWRHGSQPYKGRR
jgi:hypothetical protein